MGRPLAEPVDDLPAAGELHPALDLLAADFRLARLRPAPAHSHHRREPRSSGSTARPTAANPEEQEEAWAVFPMTRLRPEQVAGALFQAASVTTLGPQSHWFIRLSTYTGRNDFVRRYGDTGEDEFDARSGTIPQRLLLMNGDIVRDKIKDDIFTAPARSPISPPTTARPSKPRSSPSSPAGRLRRNVAFRLAG